ncbi:MAG: cation:proton antiporter [Gemmatimonadota bacterium]|nr:cation:proton antiporter [Gemmatimonadota bacterium]
MTLASAPAAAAAELPFLSQLVLVFAVAAAFTYVCQRLRLVPIIGFLVAGIAVGPHALGLVDSPELISGMAEIGVILLLFTIGVEFSLSKLALIRRFILIGGGIQVGLTVGLTCLLLLLAGADWRVGIYTGCLVALSSTAIVLKLFSDAGTTDTPVGRIGLGVLIFQDLAVILMVLLVPVLAGAGRGAVPILLTLGRALLIIVATLALASRAVPLLLDRVAAARNTELFLLTVVVICFGIAWLTSLGGVSVSLGAFLAGLVVSGSRFREYAVGEILPLRTLFNAVFFVSVGMLLDVGIVVERPLLVLGIAAGVLVLKGTATLVGVLALRYPLHVAGLVALSLAQIGEFSFVLEVAGRAEGLTPGGFGDEGRQVFLAVTVLLMTATPFLVRAGSRMPGMAGDDGPVTGTAPDTTGPIGSPRVPARGHVVVCGYGLAGRSIQNALGQLGIPHVVVDLNPVSVLEAQAFGIPAVYGDLTRGSVLEEVNAHAARLVVIAINDTEATKRIAQRVKISHAEIEVVVRVPYAVDAPPLREIGCEVVVVEEVESAVHLLEETLHGCSVPAEEVEIQIARLRCRGELDET